MANNQNTPLNQDICQGKKAHRPPAYRSQLYALPSLLLTQDQVTLPFDTSNPENNCRKICGNIGRQLSLFYTSHPEEWNQLIDLTSDI